MREMTRSYAAGSVLFEEHDPGSRMYVVKRGKVKISRQLADTEVVLAVIPEGEFFGEMALLESLPRSATATVLEDADLIEIDKETFEQMIRNNSEIAVRMMRKLCERLRETDRRLHNALIENGLGRVIEVLRGVVSRGMASSDGEWVEATPADAKLDIFTQAGIAVAQRRDVEDRLTKARLIRRYARNFFVASDARLRAYSDFLQLHQTYEPLISKELGEGGLETPDAQKLVKRILIDKMASEGDETSDLASERVIKEYERYLDLKQKFG